MIDKKPLTLRAMLNRKNFSVKFNDGCIEHIISIVRHSDRRTLLVCTLTDGHRAVFEASAPIILVESAFCK